MKLPKIILKLKDSVCGKCKTGQYTYELDKKEPMCPNIGCYKNNSCCYYKPLDKNHSGFIKKLFNRVFLSTRK